MKDHFYLPFLLIIFHVVLLHCSLNKVGALDSNTDREALLSFKLGVSVDPQNALSGWSHSSSHCSWFGVSCTNNDIDKRVRSLHLAGLGLFGTLSPHLSNLSSLRRLNLSENSFYGQIPPEIGRLSLLKHFNLAGNSINGTIPATLSQCHDLREIGLSFNKLTGHLPQELGGLSRLRVLDASGNNLTGVIPLTFGNLSSLAILALARNQLYGSIPNELGHLRNLLKISFSENQLSGEIPPLIFNISSLVYFSITKNNFTGKLPTDMGSALLNITHLYLAQNRFQGSLPDSLSNASKIQFLELSINHFQGSIPSLGNMNELVFLNLGANNLSSTTEQNFQLFESLTNCTQLQSFIIYANRLAGELPSSLANLSDGLTHFCVDNNLFTGSFPRGIGKYQNLISLAIQRNYFTGQIPGSIGGLHKLQQMSLQENKFSGEIPDMFGNLTGLYRLIAGANQFSGQIPLSIGGCQHLTTLDLAWNRLVGSVPKEIFGLHNMNYLYLAQNSLNGSLPIELGSMKQLEFMDVSDNQLSGNLPETIDGCLSMRYLSVARNNFTGSIPKPVGKLVALESLDLSSNSLSGPIPEEIGKLRVEVLQKLNLSFNDLEGQVPRNGVFRNLGWDSFLGNPKLCGSDQEVAGRLRIPVCVKEKKSSRRVFLKTIILVVSSVILVSAMFCLIWAFISQKKKKRMHRGGMSSPSLKGLPPKISYSDIQVATNGFVAENLIGKGSFGSVYKGVFGTSESEVYTTLAIKVLDLHQSKALRSFNAECEALRNVRHRNLVRVITSCSSIDHRGGEFKALVMEFMPNGSLHNWLHPKESESQLNLNLTQRLDIAIDVASAIDYLHHDCEPPIVHCDLKPPNVLLDDNLGARVGDFGLARLLHPNSPENKSTTIGLKGTIGYIAPEYGLGSKVSTRGDVYSFGIMLLEIFIAKKPTDEMFKDGLNLNKFASAVQQNQVLKIVDARLFKTNNSSEENNSNSSSSDGGSSSSNSRINAFSNWDSRIEQCLAALMRVGLSCAADSAGDRPTMRETLTKLLEIKRILMG